MFFSTKLLTSFAITLLAVAPNCLTVFAALSGECYTETFTLIFDPALRALVDNSTVVSNDTAYASDFSMYTEEYRTTCLALGGASASFFDATGDCEGEPTFTATYLSRPFCYGTSCSQADMEEYTRLNFTVLFSTRPDSPDGCNVTDGTYAMSDGTGDPSPIEKRTVSGVAGRAWTPFSVFLVMAASFCASSMM